MDKLALLHPSLGLSFTVEFRTDMGVTFVGRMTSLTQFSPAKDADSLPAGCDGCREEVGGRLVCCQLGFQLEEDAE